MDTKKALMSVAKVLGMDLKFNEEDIMLAETILEDDTVVYTLDNLELGVVVYSNTDMTEELKDGSYVTKDGTTFEVIDGVVGEYEAVETEEVVEEEVPAEEEVVEEEVPAEEEVTEEVVEEEVTEEVVEEVVTEEDEVIETEVTEEEVIDEEDNVVVVKSIETVDGAKLYYNPGEELAIDTKLYTDELMETLVEEVEYSTVDGLVIEVLAGIITKITSVIEAFTALKETVRILTADLEDATKEFKVVTESNTKLSSALEDIKAKQALAPASDSIKFRKVEPTKVAKQKYDVYAYLDNRK